MNMNKLNVTEFQMLTLILTIKENERLSVFQYHRKMHVLTMIDHIPCVSYFVTVVVKKTFRL